MDYCVEVRDCACRCVGEVRVAVGEVGVEDTLELFVDGWVGGEKVEGVCKGAAGGATTGRENVG